MKNIYDPPPAVPDPPPQWYGLEFWGGAWGSSALRLAPGCSGALLGAPGHSWVLLGTPGWSLARLGALTRSWAPTVVFIVFSFAFSMIFDMRLLISLRLFSLLSWFAFSLPLFLSRFSLVLSFLQAPRDAPQPTVPQGGGRGIPQTIQTIPFGVGGGQRPIIYRAAGKACISSNPKPLNIEQPENFLIIERSEKLRYRAARQL